MLQAPPRRQKKTWLSHFFWVPDLSVPCWGDFRRNHLHKKAESVNSRTEKWHTERRISATDLSTI
jgi:hypothetical protein